jgi:hypothetical protein
MVMFNSYVNVYQGVPVVSCCVMISSGLPVSSNMLSECFPAEKTRHEGSSTRFLQQAMVD